MSKFTDPEWKALLRKAETAGKKAGAASASWFFDGNTTKETYRRVLRGIDDGDPEILDRFPVLDLSGQWGGGTTDRDVLDDIGVDEDEYTAEAEDALINAYRDAHDIEVGRVIEKEARRGAR